MSNAHFALVSTYQDLVPAFQHLYARSGNLSQFYGRVKALAKMEKSQRRSALASMLTSPAQVIPVRRDRTVAAQ
jgi:predicted aminopeptidase